MERPKHPAKFSDELLPVLVRYCDCYSSLLDPMAGTGKVARLRDHGFLGRITCNDLEPDWVDPGCVVDEWHFTDAARMDWAKDGQFDVICTSPTYGNRMADHHDAKDASKRYTYKHSLGHDLHEGNTGVMQWGQSYRTKHAQILQECFRVLAPNGALVVNVSNHVRKGEVVNVVAWWEEAIVEAGFESFDYVEVRTRRMRNGENAGARVESESILVYRKPVPRRVVEW